jgi:hypothetical protein
LFPTRTLPPSDAHKAVQQRADAHLKAIPTKIVINNSFFIPYL